MASFINDKKPSIVMESVITHWMSNYWTCSKLLNDLGGEFTGEELRELLGTMGIRVSTTAAFSPFSNGIVERHNANLKSMMSKLRDDTELRDLDSETILKNACYAKNTLGNRHGFSLFQVVFGKSQCQLNMEFSYQTCENKNSMRKFEKLTTKAPKELIVAENTIRIKAVLSNGHSTYHDILQLNDIVSHFRNGTETEQ